MSKRRVLFVDDEPNLLAGLRRMLRFQRNEWEMAFAEGGERALELMAEEPFDAVVSDMRMPGMDGGQLLAEVQRRHPQTARLVLSGHADRAAIISAVGPTQQYLAKPCDADVLIAVLNRVLAVRDLVTDERLRDLLGGVQSLPKPPHIYQEMMAMSADPECRLEAVVSVIERDVGTSAEVLRLVNSAFFGLPSPVTTIGRAVSLLGLETIQALAVAGAVFGAGGPLPPGLDARRLSRRGMGVGMLARQLAVSEGWDRQSTGDAFFTGLLHEVALPVLAGAHPQAWAVVRSAMPTGLEAAHQLERDQFGCTVTEAGAYLLGMWGFAEPVVEAIATQPAMADDASALPASLVLTFARQEHLFPGGVHRTSTTGYLTDARLLSWQAVADDFAMTHREDDTLQDDDDEDEDDEGS